MISSGSRLKMAHLTAKLSLRFFQQSELALMGEKLSTTKFLLLILDGLTKEISMVRQCISEMAKRYHQHLLKN
jgi:hypothetical protein